MKLGISIAILLAVIGVIGMGQCDNEAEYSVKAKVVLTEVDNGWNVVCYYFFNVYAESRHESVAKSLDEALELSRKYVEDAPAWVEDYMNKRKTKP